MTDDQLDQDKVRKERSPSFPFISLWKAVDRVKEMAEAHKKNQARLPIVGTTWGYASKSSGLLQTVAALKAYGLIDDIGAGPERKIQITDLGWKILHDQRPGAREAAIKEAALKPRLIAEYVSQWVPDRPSDAHCMSELQLDRGFNEAAANTFLRVFDKTVEFAGLSNGDSLSPVLDQEENAVENVMSGDSPVGQVFRRAAPVTAPQLSSGEPFTMTMGSERISGTFNLTRQEDADEMIRRITALKTFLKPAEPKES